MTNQKLLMFVVAGLLAPVAFDGVASAEVRTSVVSVAVPAPTNDKAPVTGTPARLRRTDQEQAGNEMTAFSFFGDGIHGLYFAMTTELNGTRAPNNIQLSLTPFALVQDAATGTVSASANTTAAKFVTNNRGNERRNANAPTAMTVNNGSVVCAKYNYQPNGTNDTVRYIQCFNQAGAVVTPQVKAFAKNNDDCAMHQDGEPGQVASFDPATITTKVVEWGGCNGNGNDDGYAWVTTLKCDSATAPTSCQFKNVFDVSLAQREERSRGNCTVGTDASYAICTWTEGNNQPQRDGVWMAAVDLSTKAAGANQQQTVLWKKQLGGRIDANPAAANRRTYAQRAVQERVMTLGPTGALVPSDRIMFRWGDAAGNNNTNEGKGGTYYTQMMSIIQVSRTGMTYITKPVDMAQTLRGLGGTHLGATTAIFGNADAPMAGLVFLNGSHTGGVSGAQIRSVGLDGTNQFVDLGMQQIAPHDRHLYSNYLGNNPGNQGRNHSQMTTVANPFVGTAGNTDKFLLVSATSGKTMATTCTGCLDTSMDPAIKLTALLTVTPIAQQHGAGTGTGGGTGGGTGAGTGGGSGSGSGSSGDGGDPGTTLGGCSAGTGSSGLAAFLLIGLAALRRRRR